MFFLALVFKLYNENVKFYLQNKALSGLQASYVYLNKLDFYNKTNEKHTTRKITSSLNCFHEIVPSLTREPRSLGAPKRKNRKTNIYIYIVVGVLFSLVVRPKKVPRGPQDGSRLRKMGPRWLKMVQDVLRMAQDGQRRSQEVPKMTQDGSIWAQDGSRWAQDGSRWAQDGPNIAQYG
jgi:hypothetical protein